MMMSRSKFALSLAAASLLAGCSVFQQAPVNTRVDPTFKDANDNAFLNSSKDAVGKLLAGLEPGAVGPGPVLVATIVDVNDTTRSASNRNKIVRGPHPGGVRRNSTILASTTGGI